MDPNDDSGDAGPRASLVPGLAVTAVAVVSVVAAVMVQRAETKMQREAALEAARPPAATRAMGAAAACGDCGVVEAAAAVYDPGRAQPRGFRMRIRMDDGTVRTIEQRGALAAGSRVVVEGSAARPM